jgi:hypothetical protein
MTNRRTTETNRRNTDRLPSFLGGTIIYNRNRWSTPCVVKNLSRTGARLTVRNSPPLPDSFELHIPTKNVTYAVSAKWRKDDVVGVAIDGIVPESEPKPRAAPARRVPDVEDLGI